MTVRRTAEATEMDWFERLTGFREAGYEETRRLLRVDGERLHSTVSGASYGIGRLELVSLRDLRSRAAEAQSPGKLRFSDILGDVGLLHSEPKYAGALFQVASQFNLLEMVSPDVKPEDGVTIYQHDHTQGPACAIAAGAATIYRNYFVPIGAGYGQTSTRQLDGLADIGTTLSKVTGLPVGGLWNMRNGYALCSAEGLKATSTWLAEASPAARDELRGSLKVGLHWNVEVTAGVTAGHQFVSQAFCSALPVSYSRLPPDDWRDFAEFVLEAAYEATLWAAAINARNGGSKILLLTRLGGGAFGNNGRWIDRAMKRALDLVAGCDLDVRLVRRG